MSCDHTATAIAFEAVTGTVEETERLGARLGALLRAGDVVLLRGELGAGKTAFTRGLARGVGSDDLVTSPTFVLVNEYDGPLRLYHADLYRLDDPDSVADLELGDYARDGVLIVEWPERGEDTLPAEHLLVELAYAGENHRRLTFSASGIRASTLLAAFRDDEGQGALG
jgi:tRNA threonylcarbamoyladenosine biosynthesis protein TsaE